jgi:uncharacterized protein
MNPAQAVLLLAVRFYRWVLSPLKTVLFGSLGQCRYTPTCSQYALEAITTQGAIRGSWLTARRLCRCHPWGGFGPDPVPVPPAPALHPRPGPLSTSRF